MTGSRIGPEEVISECRTFVVLKQGNGQRKTATCLRNSEANLKASKII